MSKENVGEKEKTLEKFDKKLKKHINSASSAKAWSDLLPIMKDILSLLTRNNEYDFNKISLANKQTLAKRLAQGLNPECPSGLHDVTLDVYEIILKNLITKYENKLMDNLHLYAYGLFAFFPNATIPNKIKFLNNIVNQIFISLNKEELKLCLPGLLSSLIPGLDDNNDQTTKLIYKVFDDLISRNNGELERDFFGVYWMLLLRCQHLRSSGIKYILEKITKYSDFKKLDDNAKKDIIEKQYPNINITVINALCEIIKDKEIPTIRNGMDFIITKLPLTKDNNMINDEAKVNLIISGLQLFIQNEYSAVRRLKNWILGINTPDDEVAFDTEDMKYKMSLVIKAFKILFNPDKNIQTKELLDNIKIIQRLFQNEDKFIKLILPDISYNILKCIVNYWKEELDCSENVENNEIINKFLELFNINETCFDCLWKSLADNIKGLSKEENLDNLNKKISEDILPLKFCLIFIEMKSDEKRIQYYVPLISNLLDITKNCSLKREDFKQIKKLIIITLAFVKTIQESKFYEKNNEKIDNDKQINKINEVHNQYEIYDKVLDENNKNGFNLKVRKSILSEISLVDDINYEDYEDNNNNYNNVYNISEISYISNILKNKKNIEIMSDLTNNIIKFQDYYIKILKEYSYMDNELTKFEILFFRQCAELIIRLQEYSQENENEIPLWVKYLEKIIFKKDNPNLVLSIEAANILLDLNLSSSLINNTYLKIKNNFKSEKIDDDIIDKSYIEKYTKKMKIQPNCFELLLAKFYLLSNKQSNQTMIIELLFKMYISENNKFVEIINNTFIEGEDLIENIKLFSNFWKLINEYYADDIIFQKGECIFKMLDLLNDKNPLLRHLSKSWLNQASQPYKKIINPILLVLLDKEIIFEKNAENNTEFINEFDTTKILDAFTKLKNMILYCPLMAYLQSESLPDEFISMIKFESFNQISMSYLQTLISITLHYTRTKSSDKLNEKFQKEVLSVNAASCELLEFLININEDKQYLIHNNKLINDTILNLLDISLRQNDEVMPTQLLDVLKALYFTFPIKLINNPKDKTQLDDKKLFLGLLKNKILINILIKGMTNNHFYIREHFISFTKKCVETYIMAITIDDKLELKNFYNLCNKFIKPLSNSLCNELKIDNQEEKEKTEKFSHYDKNNNKIIFKNYCEEYKEYKKYDENVVFSILKGINDIISYCFKNEILEKSNKSGSKEKVSFFFIPLPFKKKQKVKSNFSNNWKAHKKELANNMKANNPFLSFLNVVSNVIIDYTDENPNKEITNMPTNLYENQIFNLLNNFLSIWINQSDRYELYDYCLNSNGILAYNKIDSWKNLTEEQISSAIENIKNQPIKQYIITIAKNLFVTDSIKFIENLIELWVLDRINNNNKGNTVFNAIIDKQYKLSIIELLITMEIPLDLILFCVGNILQNKMSQKDIYKKKDKYYETPIDQSIYEAKIFHFIYSFILLNPNKYSKEKNENEIIEIWKEILNILNNSINNSKIIYSFCWMYEILQLASEKFNVQNIDNKDIKNGIESVFNVITYKLIDAAFLDKVDSRYLGFNILVIPILPHVYTNIVKCLYNNDNLYEKNLEGNNVKNRGDNNEEINTIDRNSKKILTSFFNKTDDSSLEDKSKKRIKTLVNSIEQNDYYNIDNCDPTNRINIFFREYINIAKNSSEYNKDYIPAILKPEDLNGIYRNFAFITLKENFYPLIKNFFDDNIATVKKYYSDIVNKLLNLMKNTSESPFRLTFANEFLVSLMENTPKNIALSGKGPLMDYIKSSFLFNSTLRELHGWKIIISKLTDHYPEILNDLINDINDKNIFVKKSEKNKKEILRRISFVIYSCEKDKFSKDFGLIRAKAMELLSEYNENNLLEREIFLIMRMLFLRFSHDGVMQMIRDLWPIIFTELIKNLLKNLKSAYDFLLLLESFKFIELLSLVNIEEFSLYQWIFMLDTFSMKDLDIKDKESLLNKILYNKDKLFKPLSLEIIGNEEIKDKEKLLEGKHKGKSELYINAKDRKTLRDKIIQFIYSIGDMNSYKVKANYNQIEEIIENDFNQKENSINEGWE